MTPPYTEFTAVREQACSRGCPRTSPVDQVAWVVWVGAVSIMVVVVADATGWPRVAVVVRFMGFPLLVWGLPRTGLRRRFLDHPLSLRASVDTITKLLLHVERVIHTKTAG